MTTQEIVAPPLPRRRGIRAFFKNLLYWVLDIDDITPEEARERMRKGRGFLDSLTPEQLEYLKTHEGSDYLGPPITKRNRHLLLHPERHELSGPDSRSLFRARIRSWSMGWRRY
ncbi:MAG TPA: hypothetical protein VEQ60_21720 [Longimicrobium sp.]|nr:hypothetical protein [Longimicrobium sp.]